MTNMKFLVRVLPLTALLSGTALLAGCGSDPAPATTTTTTEQSTTTTPPPPPVQSTTTTTTSQTSPSP